MAKESILRIAEAEQSAEGIENSARTEYDTILKDAQISADKIITEAELEAKEIIKSAKKKAEQVIAKSEAQTESDGKLKTAELRKRADANYEKTVDMLIETLVD